MSIYPRVSRIPTWGDPALWLLLRGARATSEGDLPDLRRVEKAPPLREVQEAALRAMVDTAEGEGPWGPRGAVLMLGCGHGKSLLSYIAPAVYRARRPLLVVPASLKTQTNAQYAVWSKLYRCGPSPVVVSYETVSALGHKGTLDALQPDLIILDEFHLVGNAVSARWLRIARYIQQNPTCRVVALSGTAISASILQCAHVFHACLRDWNPLPRGRTLDLWAECIDLGNEPSQDALTYMRPLTHWAREPHSKEGLRRAYRRHVSTSRGVAVSEGTSADVSLRIDLWRPDALAPSLPILSAMDRLRSRWELPDGTVLVDALEFDRHKRTLPLGFFTRPRPPIDEAWTKARYAWFRVVKANVGVGGADSPGEVGILAESGKLGRHVSEIWRTWSKARRFTPPTEPVWVDRDRPLGLVTAYLALDRNNHDSIIWTRSVALGGLLGREGIPYHGQGSAAPQRGLCVASWAVHGKGWNGQAYARQLVLEGPTNAAQWEQLLARTHRPGQTRDVTATILMEGPFCEESYARAMAGAHFIEDTTGEPQRLLYADTVRIGANTRKHKGPLTVA